jgi:hypothetical protein
MEYSDLSMFDLDDDQKAKLAVWVVEQDAKVLAQQRLKDDPHLRMFTEHGPYYGAIGGAVTYCFTPNSIGMVVTVKHATTGEEIDLTDYEAW